jgi:predicted PurR-regulated permease PerM
VSITDYQVIDVNTVDILDLKFSTSFTNETYKNQTQPIKWIASAVQDNTNSPKRRVLQYIGLICILVVVTVTVALFAYFRRKSLPKYWQGFKKAVLWNPR